MWKPTISSDELYHHGIQGMHWGQRNGPPYPLSSSQKSSSEKRDDDLTDYVRRKAKDHEPAITKDFRSAVNSSTAKIYGLNNRLKTPESISRKIEKNTKEKGISEKEAASDIKDAVRYTAISTDNDFVQNYSNIKKTLEKKSYEETRCKNYWDEYRQGKVKHKSVQCTFKDPYGYEFEIQFHTPSSQDVKTKKIPLYEEVRKIDTTPARRTQIEFQMTKLAENVTEPKDIYKIKSH